MGFDGIKRTFTAQVRLSPSERRAMENQAAKRGLGENSAYLRWLIKEDARRIQREKGTNG